MGYPLYTRGGYCFTQGGTVWVIPFTQGAGITLHKWGYPFVVHKNFIFYKSTKTYYRIHGLSRDFRYTKMPCRLKRPAGPAYPNIKHMGRRRARLYLRCKKYAAGRLFTSLPAAYSINLYNFKYRLDLAYYAVNRMARALILQVLHTCRPLRRSRRRRQVPPARPPFPR